jgi:hypothetical protein
LALGPWALWLKVEEDACLVILVENLAKQYVLQDNCIVLLTLPKTRLAIIKKSFPSDEP